MSLPTQEEINDLPYHFVTIAGRYYGNIKAERLLYAGYRMNRLAVHLSDVFLNELMSKLSDVYLTDLLHDAMLHNAVNNAPGLTAVYKEFLNRNLWPNQRTVRLLLKGHKLINYHKNIHPDYYWIWYEIASDAKRHAFHQWFNNYQWANEGCNIDWFKNDLDCFINRMKVKIQWGMC